MGHKIATRFEDCILYWPEREHSTIGVVTFDRFPHQETVPDVIQKSTGRHPTIEQKQWE